MDAQCRSKAKVFLRASYAFSVHHHTSFPHLFSIDLYAWFFPFSFSLSNTIYVRGKERGSKEKGGCIRYQL